MNIIVEAEHICFSYGRREKRQLQDISLTVVRGELFVILGRNGSGKSTLLRQLAGLLPLQEGKLKIGGLDASDQKNARAIRKMCGMVFQNPDTQFVSSVVEEDIRFGLENYDTPEELIQEKVLEALASVDMSGSEKMSTHMLSGGQKQRIALAGALAVSPDLLFLDEVTSMLDADGRAEVLKIVERLRNRGKTIIYVTHDVEEAVIADRVLVMEQGKILAEGKPREILENETLVRRAGLCLPFASGVYRELQKYGADREKSVLTTEELVRVLGENDQGKKAFAHWIREEQSYAGEIWKGLGLDESDALGKRKDLRSDEKAGSTSLLPLLESERVFYCYAKGSSLAKDALTGVSLSIQKGELIGITGKTGCGKTTLIQILAGLLEPDEGQVFFYGKNISDRHLDRKRLRRALGVVFQFPEYQLFEKTVEKDVGFGLDYLGLDADQKEEAVKSALERMGFVYEKIKDRIPAALSGGEKRRVAIAGVLAKKPEILIFDEPLAGLDAEGKGTFLEMLKAYCREGKAVLVISHDLEHLMQVSDRLVYMAEGEIAFEGDRAGYANWVKGEAGRGEKCRMQEWLERMRG